MFQNEELKLYKFNAHLNKIQNKKRFDRQCNETASVTFSNDKNIYHFQVELEELIHNPRIKPEHSYNYKKNLNNPPQQEFLLDLFSHKTNKNDNVICDMISPCVNKSLWYRKNNLIRNRTLKIIIKLNDLDMTDILRNCLHPKTCLDPEKYIIKGNPQLFVNTINELRNENDIFNYIFNFWEYIPRYDINDDAVYKLKSNIHLIDEKCF